MLHISKTKIVPFAAAAASGVLLRFAFPPFSNGDIAFFALIPLLLALRASTPRAGFRLGLIFGLVFRISSQWWIAVLKDNGGPLPLVVLGIIALSTWIALFSGIFGWLSSSLWSLSRRADLPLPGLFQSWAWLSEALLWAGCDYLAGTVLSGFPWNPLAATQSRNLALLSLLSIGGAPLLSALIVAVNSGLASLFYRIWSDAILPRFPQLASSSVTRRPSRIPRSLPLGFALSLLVAVWWHGIDRVRAFERSFRNLPRFRVALIHPESPCIFERDDDAVRLSNETLLSLTALASSTSPDLVVWPETSLPGYMPYDPDATRIVREACATSAAPLAAGAVEYLPTFPGDIDGLIFNSAFLFKNASIVCTYRKRHLVPFGEFIPLETKIPALKRLAPAGFSCEPGRDIALFDIANQSSSSNNATAKIAPLICFEDVFPQLARESATSGASALLSLANDAWFGGTCEPEQHLRHAIMRAVETGLPVIRATNQGVTAIILPNGRIQQRLDPGEPGFLTADVPIAPNPPMSFFTRHGDSCFALPCAGYVFGLAFASLLNRHRHRCRPS